MSGAFVHRSRQESTVRGACRLPVWCGPAPRCTPTGHSMYPVLMTDSATEALIAAACGKLQQLVLSYPTVMLSYVEQPLWTFAVL